METLGVTVDVLAEAKKITPADFKVVVMRISLAASGVAAGTLPGELAALLAGRG